MPIPEVIPITAEDHNETYPEHGAILTNPQIAPEHHPEILDLSVNRYCVKVQPRTPPAADNCVLIKAFDETRSIEEDEDELKPNEANHINPVPITVDKVPVEFFRICSSFF
jgi:hypothetical protein